MKSPGLWICQRPVSSPSQFDFEFSQADKGYVISNVK